MAKIAILGSGMAGFGAAHRLNTEGLQATMYDKNSYYGGHTTSYIHDSGFVYDEGPHVSFTKIERLRELFAANVSHEYFEWKEKVTNYWKGYWIKHPAQCNLYGLPVDLVVDILRDFAEASQRDDHHPKNYEEWLYASFGKTFAETFPKQYTIKYHTTTADNMSTDWIGPRLYRPKLDEMLRGALSPATADVHYVGGFRYPARNGFVSYLDKFRKKTDLRLNHKLTGINPKLKQLRFTNGSVVDYEHVVSSIPLPEIVPMIDGVPNDVQEASRKLACTTAVVVNLGINRHNLLDAHWAYFYDQDIFFTRISTPHLQSPNNVPAGCGSFQVECYYSDKYRPLDRKPEECIEPVIADLRRIGLLREEDAVLFKEAKLIRYANVIFDLERAPALTLVHAFLDDVGIGYCGRYGDWTYIWTDQAFVSGEKAAQKMIDRMLT